MPFTRWSSSSEPNGPSESRLAMMRAARAGPTRGRASSSEAEATSGSMGWAGVADFLVDDLARRASLALSTAARWRSKACAPAFWVARPSAVRAGVSGASDWASAWSRARSNARACSMRTPPPSRATVARKATAWRSAAVGMPEDGGAGPPGRHRNVARGMIDPQGGDWSCYLYPPHDRVSGQKSRLSHSLRPREYRCSPKSRMAVCQMDVSSAEQPVARPYGYSPQQHYPAMRPKAIRLFGLSIAQVAPSSAGCAHRPPPLCRVTQPNTTRPAASSP